MEKPEDKTFDVKMSSTESIKCSVDQGPLNTGDEHPPPPPPPPPPHSKENKLQGTKEKKCEEQLSTSLPKQSKKKAKTGSVVEGDKKDKDSKNKQPKMDIYIETVLSDSGNNVEESVIQDEGAHGGSVILQAIVDCAVSETLGMQTFESTIIDGETYELPNATEESQTDSNLLENQVIAKNNTKNTKCKRKEKVTNEEEEMLIPIDTGMVVEVIENEEGVESTSIPVNTPEKAPDYGYMSYAHNFGVDAETDDKESEGIANLTGDEQDKDKSNKIETVSQPQYTVQSGYSPKSRPHTPKTLATKNTLADASESAIKKSKKPSEGENETVSLPVTSIQPKPSAAKAKTKSKNVVSTKAQKKTSATLKTNSKIERSSPKKTEKSSPKKNQSDTVNAEPVTSPKEDTNKEPQKVARKKPSKTRKTKIDRINKVMAALNNSPVNSADNTTEHLETNLSPTKDKTKKKKKSRSKDKERKDKDKKKKRKHKSSKDKHELIGSKKKKKKAKKDKGDSPGKADPILESLESPRHHHHHKPKKKTRKDKGKHRKKSTESELSPKDTSSVCDELKIKKLSEKISRLESSIQSEKHESKTKHSTTQKCPAKKRPLEKLYDVDVASHTPKLKTVGRKPLKNKKQNSRKDSTACKSKSKECMTHDKDTSANENRQSKDSNSKCKIVEEQRLNISTPLHIDIPEDRPVQYTKSVGRGRGRGRRKYGSSRILAVKKPCKQTPETEKNVKIPEEKDLTTKHSAQKEDTDPATKHSAQIVLEEEKDLTAKHSAQFGDKIEKDNVEQPQNSGSEELAQKKNPSDDTEKDKSKEQTPSPQSATTCMSEEALFSDSGIGTDNNSNADHQANDKSRKNNDVEIAPGVMSSHPLATSAHGLYGYGKKEKIKKQMNWPVTLGRRKRKKHRLLRPPTRITPEFIFELDALILQLRALRLEDPEQMDESSLSMAGKKNHLSSLVKLTTGFSTMLRPSYLGTVMNIQSDKLRHKKKKKDKHRRRESRENTGDGGKQISPVSQKSGEPSESGELSPLKITGESTKTDVEPPKESSSGDTNDKQGTEESTDEVKVTETKESESKEPLAEEKSLESSGFEEFSSITEAEQSHSEKSLIESKPSTPQPQKVKPKLPIVQKSRRRRGKGRGFTRRKMRGTYQSKKLQLLMREKNSDSVLNDNAILNQGNQETEKFSVDNEFDDGDFQDAVEECHNDNPSNEMISNVVSSTGAKENNDENSVDIAPRENLDKQSLEKSLDKQSRPVDRTETLDIFKTNIQVKFKRKPGRPRQKKRKPGRPRKTPVVEIVNPTANHCTEDFVHENNNVTHVVDVADRNVFIEDEPNKELNQLEVDVPRETTISKETESAVIVEQETLFLRRSPNINISDLSERVEVEKPYESANPDFDSVKRKIDAAIKACVDKIKNTKRFESTILNVSQDTHHIEEQVVPKRRGGFLSPMLKPKIQEEFNQKKNTNKPRLKAELLSQHQNKRHFSKLKRRKSRKLVTCAIERHYNKQGNQLTTVSDESRIVEDQESESASVPLVPTSIIDDNGSDEMDLVESLSDESHSMTSGALKSVQKKVLKGGKGDKRKAISDNVDSMLPLKKRKLTLTVKEDGTGASSETNLKIVSVAVDDAELKETSILPGIQNLKGFEKGSKGRKRRAEQRRRDDKPPKKKYWKAGMYSSSFKEDAIPKKSVKSNEKKLLDETIDRPACGFLPKPIHVGRYLREERRDFTLPYDLWWLSIHKKLLSRQDTISFKKIRTNLHVDVKPTSGLEHVRCSCKVPTPNEPGCGEDCINRMTFTECNMNTCPCGEQCSNQQIQRHQWCPDLERFMTVDRGWGIMSKTPIKQHKFILEYVGEVISVKEFLKRATTDYQHRKHHYCLNLDSTHVIDGHRAANEGRFVNHSCEPNCEMQKWCVQGVYRIGLFALQDIAANEELTYDYNFHAFSLEGQQVCKCKSLSCRGYIGGRGQKPSNNGSLKKIMSNKRVGRPPKDKRKSKNTLKKLHDHSIESTSLACQRLQLPKPMSMREMKIIAERQIFLIRNIEKVKRVREGLRKAHMGINEPSTPKEDDRDVFMAQFRALNSSRSVKTRHLAAAEENTEVTTAARLAQIFKDIYTAVCMYRDASGQCLAIPFMNLPSKKRNRDYYSRISDPIDLSTIERKIVTGHYKTVDNFDEDFKKLFKNAEKYHGKKSELGRDAVHLFKVYSSAMTTNSKHFRSIMGTKSVAESTCKEDGQKASKDDEEEEVIRCLCGLLNDEGLMIQCDKCMVWQHFDCIGLPYDKEPDHYICELCKPREVAEEIKMTPQPKYAQPGQTYYLCLTRDDGTRVKMGDCAYLPRTEEDSNTPTIVPSNANIHSTHIIFRVEQLWKNDKGERFAFGHHFLRPHETHHTPSRKFFKNELFRGPFYEIIRLDLIIGFCCVMDLYTYCKGRPKNIKEDDIYICEYRLDKTAHLFHPISKNKFPICTKSYAFNKFDKKIIPKRDYSPHYVPEHYKRGYGGRPTWKCNRENDQEHEPNKKGLNGKVPSKQEAALKRMQQSLAGKRNALKNNNNRQQKQKRVNAISQGLLDKLPGKQPVDLTFLLECPGKRQRKKPATESFI